MFQFQFVKHIIETVIEIYEILLIWWVDPQYSWSQGIGSPIVKLFVQLNVMLVCRNNKTKHTGIYFIFIHLPPNYIQET